jgi:hypothetical protein
VGCVLPERHRGAIRQSSTHRLRHARGADLVHWVVHRAYGQSPGRRPAESRAACPRFLSTRPLRDPGLSHREKPLVRQGVRSPTPLRHGTLRFPREAIPRERVGRRRIRPERCGGSSVHPPPCARSDRQQERECRRHRMVANPIRSRRVRRARTGTRRRGLGASTASARSASVAREALAHLGFSPTWEGVRPSCQRVRSGASISGIRCSEPQQDA